MGLRCSLTGHDFGPPETERDREERGDEVVITIRELQVCTRCGAEQVTSESTEVRPVRPAPDSVTDSDEDTQPAEPPDPTPVEEPPADEEPTEPDVEDDAVILEDEDEEHPDRAPGQWPDADDTRMSEDTPTAGEPVEEDDAGAADTTSEPAPEDAESAADDSEPPAEREGTEGWPDPGRGDDEGFDATSPQAGDSPEGYVEAPEDGPDTGFVSPSEETVSVEEADAVFVCPSCDFQEPVAGSSLRSGDICPACKKGYLTEES